MSNPIDEFHEDKMRSLKLYIKETEGRHLTRRERCSLKSDVPLSLNAIDHLCGFALEHLKDSHQIADLVYIVLDILNEENKV